MGGMGWDWLAMRTRIEGWSGNFLEVVGVGLIFFWVVDWW